MNTRRIVFKIVIVVLVLSIIISWYHLNLRAQNQNVLNNMRSRALASYGSEMSAIAFFLEEYLVTSDYDIIDHEVLWSIARAIWVADSCTEGLDPDSGQLYYELKGAALALEFHFLYSSGLNNATKVQIIVQLVRSIGEPFGGLYMSENEDPLQHLISYHDVDAIVNQCKQLIEIIGYGYVPY